MPRRFERLSDFFDNGFDTVIDVRSPAEFAEDHVPGAISLPALSNAERAEVGTIYKQQSPFAARRLGAALVARNVATHLEGPLKNKDGAWRPLVYCWRGGQRSGSVATILNAVGWRTETIEGGYKSYRAKIVDLLYDKPVAISPVLLDGNTGTAKTAVLATLAEMGHQVIDLEGLARHRGSILGGEADPQPAQKAFESALALVLDRLDPAKPVVIEAESSKIGELLVPVGLWKAMCSAPRLRVEAPVAQRAAYLTKRYADIIEDPTRLADTLARLLPIQGHERVEAWQRLAVAGAFETLATELITHHYDPRYASAARARDVGWVETFEANSLDANGIEALAGRVAEWLTRHEGPHALRSTDQ